MGYYLLRVSIPDALVDDEDDIIGVAELNYAWMAPGAIRHSVNPNSVTPTTVGSVRFEPINQAQYETYLEFGIKKITYPDQVWTE